MDLVLYVVERASYRTLDIRSIERPNWAVSFVLEGSLSTETNGVRSEVRAGDVMVHPPYTPFSETASGPGTHLWMAIDLKVPPNMDVFQLHPVAPVVALSDPHAYEETFCRLHGVCSQAASSFRDARAFSYTIDLVRQILEAWRSAGSPERPAEMSGRRDRFFEIIQYMQTHLAERVQREDLAKLAFLHPGYFDRIFRAAYGVSPMQMLRDLRLRHACDLLDSTQLQLDAIAEACGLSDATYLSKMFRRRYGTSPGAYREGSKKARESYISH